MTILDPIEAPDLEKSPGAAPVLTRPARSVPLPSGRPPARQGGLQALLFFHTVRHLRPIQVYARLLRSIDRAQPKAAPAPRLRSRSSLWVDAAPRPVNLTARGRVRFLNEDGEIATPAQWNDPLRPKLWLYNLHYFNDLAALADDERGHIQRDLVARWIAENPPGYGNGWEPYPLSLRIANWIKWALSGEILEPAWLESLAMQARWLTARIEWHLLGNHLLANAKALVLAGLFFQGEEAEDWLSTGLAIYARELGEQILADGGHFELSPMYHAIILEDLLDLINAGQVYGRSHGAIFAELPEIAAAMRVWLALMTHPDGGFAFFNDAAFAAGPSPAELEAYAERLGLPALTPGGEGLQHLRTSGYVRINRGEAAAILDLAAIGPDYLPGHAHADTLSFELSLGTERIVVNGGTSTYDPGSLREAERATAAHSTVEVDGENSSEVWAAFRVARRARVREISLDTGDTAWTIHAAHDGYLRLPGRPIHRREWRFEGETVRVRDGVTPASLRTALARFHLAPGIDATIDETGQSGRLVSASGRTVRWTTSGRARLEGSVWAPEFGRRVPSQTLIAPLEAGALTTTFDWS